MNLSQYGNRDLGRGLFIYAFCGHLRLETNTLQADILTAHMASKFILSERPILAFCIMKNQTLSMLTTFIFFGAMQEARKSEVIPHPLE